jgi:hypothetical protein
MPRRRFFSAYCCLWLICRIPAIDPALAGKPEDCALRYTKWQEKIVDVGIETGFTRKVHIRAVQQPGKRAVVDIPFTELEKITGLEVYLLDPGGKRGKKIKDIARRSLLSSSFYDGIRAYSFVLEKSILPVPFEVSYTVTNSSLLFLSKLLLNSYDCMDTAHYTLEVPAACRLFYDIAGDTSSLRQFRIDSTASGGFTVWTFTAVSASPVQEPEKSERYVYAGRFPPCVRLLVMPASGYATGFDYFSAAYDALVKPKSALNETSAGLIASWGPGLQGHALAKCLFDSVKAKISYIAFEQGIGAVQPRDVNEVLEKRQGDCKDMANLLCQAFRSRGLPAWLAVSSTLGYPLDLDFPSLTSANHVICIADVEGDLQFLDATERCGIYGLPSKHTQSRHVLVLRNGGEIIKVPVVEPLKNQALFTFDLARQENALEGTFRFQYHGLSKIDIRRTIKENHAGDIALILTDYFNDKVKNMRFSGLSWNDTDSALVITGQVRSDSAFLAAGDRNYLSRNVFMYPHPYARNLEEAGRLIFYEALNHRFRYNVRMDKNVAAAAETAGPLEREGFFFSFGVKQDAPDLLTVEYAFRSANVDVDETRRAAYNDVNEEIAKAFNGMIRYE